MIDSTYECGAVDEVGNEGLGDGLKVAFPDEYTVIELRVKSIPAAMLASVRVCDNVSSNPSQKKSNALGVIQ